MIREEITEILKTCEEEDSNQYYYKELRKFDSKGREIFIISDLHIAGGLTKNETYSGTENFFADGSLKRFLRHIQSGSEKGKILIINGDFIDFLRITSYPQTAVEFKDWQAELEKIGLNYSTDQLNDCVSKKEKKFGLKTDDYKSIWKLHKAIRGHNEIFDALGEWLGDGNKLIITKGNHDLEWYWLNIRNYLRVVLAERVVSKEKVELTDALANYVLPNLYFIDDKMLIDDDFYIEHGHRYDKYSSVVGNPVIREGKQINIPFGSFFNRYLINRVELAYPFIDNVRPSQNILPLLMRERFFLGLKLLFYHIPFMLRIIPKRYYSYMFQRVLSFALAIIIPIIIMFISLGNKIPQVNLEADSSVVMQKIFGLLKDTAALFGSYILSRFTAYFQLKEPSRLNHPAIDLLKENPNYKIVTMGHTHNPDQFQVGERWYFNTGTWIPIVESSSMDIREDKTYTFLHVQKKPDGTYHKTRLMKWNDDAEESRNLVIVEPK